MSAFMIKCALPLIRNIQQNHQPFKLIFAVKWYIIFYILENTNALSQINKCEDSPMSIDICDELKLHPAVFFRQYSSQVVLYHTANQGIFTFAGSAGDVLECFREYRTIDNAIRMMAQSFEMDYESIASPICDFVQELIEKGILVSRQKQASSALTLEKEIAADMTEDNQLFSVLIELTYKCNERCRHCYIVDEGRPELSTHEFLDILDQLKGLNVLSIVFTGGEVFSRKDAFEILEYAYNLGFVIEVFTNGNYLEASDIIRLKQVWPRLVHFSVYSYLPEHHDRITQKKGSYDKTIKAIKDCMAVGIPVNMKTPVFAETVADIEKTIELAQTLGCTIEVGDNITPKKNGNLDPEKMQIIDPDAEDFLFKVINRLVPTDEKQPNITKSEKLCGAGDHSLSINPYGEVFLCNMFPLKLGDTTNTSLKDIWFHSEQLQWWRNNNRRDLRKSCKDCDYADQCSFCPGEALLRTGSPHGKYEKACKETRTTISRNLIVEEVQKSEG